MLLRQLAANKVGLAPDFPMKFSKIAVKDGSKVEHKVGLKTLSQEKLTELKFPKRRVVSQVIHQRMDKHWQLIFTADKVKTNKPEAPEKKLIKIDLTQDAYRIIYNAEAEDLPCSTVYIFEGTKPTVEDIYRIVVDVAKDKGRWVEDGFNCQAFVNVVIERLGTLPASGLKKV